MRQKVTQPQTDQYRRAAQMSVQSRVPGRAVRLFQNHQSMGSLVARTSARDGEGKEQMSIFVQLALKIAASAALGLLLGLEREWAHKEAGVRTFAIAALLGTIAWQLAPVLAYVQFG